MFFETCGTFISGYKNDFSRRHRRDKYATGCVRENRTRFSNHSGEKFSSAAYESLSEIVQNFLENKSHSINRACFGVAGPVRGKTAKITNLTWTADADSIVELLGHDRIKLINDLEANVYGLNELNEDDFLILNEGEPNPADNRALISAGTGVNEAGIFYKDGNMALRLLATGGAYIGGGIAPKILPKLKEKQFLESFLSKGRMRNLLELMPVRIILNDKAALLGAAHFAHYEIQDK